MEDKKNIPTLKRMSEMLQQAWQHSNNIQVCGPSVDFLCIVRQTIQQTAQLLLDYAEAHPEGAADEAPHD